MAGTDGNACPGQYAWLDTAPGLVRTTESFATCSDPGEVRWDSRKVTVTMPSMLPGEGKVAFDWDGKVTTERAVPMPASGAPSAGAAGALIGKMGSDMLAPDRAPVFPGLIAHRPPFHRVERGRRGRYPWPVRWDGRAMADGFTADEVRALFTRSDGSYLFARWGRPIVPVVFGVEDAVLPVIKGACEAVVRLAGHQMAETDPELGANLMVFFIRDWAELPAVRGMDRMIPDLGPLCARLAAANANQYRSFRLDGAGAIKAAFVFLRMDADLAGVPAETLALSQAVQTILLWSDQAFAGTSPLARLDGTVILRPEIAGVIRAGYDRAMPSVARDDSHAYRLTARLAGV